MNINEIKFTPFTTQIPGTGGLRRPTREFMSPHYAAAFVQTALDCMKESWGKVDTIGIGSDGRFFSKEFLPTLIKILIANGVKKILVANKDFVATTPAVSHMIQKYSANGGFQLSASHNPGGIDGDFGIKVESASGGQPDDNFNNMLATRAAKNDRYFMADISDSDALAKCEFVDAVEDYFELMKTLFDFDAIKKWFARGNTFKFDCMNASAGKFARRIFCDEFGMAPENILRSQPMPDFGGVHPEPNKTYNREFYDMMMAGDTDFGAAVDGDGDRNMILGRGMFISPTDSLAVMALHHNLIPYYKSKLTGIVRSIPTGSAVDDVCRDQNIKLYTTPVGWKWFTSLLESGLVQLCGEESFGQGGNYIGEKDAIFAVLYWLNIMGATGKSANEIMHDFWNKYGRMFYSQFNFEGVDATMAARYTEFIKGGGVPDAENIKYVDPVTGATTEWAGAQIITTDGVRIFIRLSGTGTQGATVRLYLEKKETDPAKFDIDSVEYLADLRTQALEIFQINKFFNHLPEQMIAI